MIQPTELAALLQKIECLRERVERLEREKMSVKIQERWIGEHLIVTRVPVDRGVSAE